MDGLIPTVLQATGAKVAKVWKARKASVSGQNLLKARLKITEFYTKLNR
jgi:hypothetical protein